MIFYYILLFLGINFNNNYLLSLQNYSSIEKLVNIENSWILNLIIIILKILS